MGHPVYQCLSTFLLNGTLKKMVKIPRHTKIMMLKKHCIRICGIYNFIYKHKQKSSIRAKSDQNNLLLFII